MNINSILATTATGSLSSYFPYILIIVGVFAVICLMNWFRGRKADDHYLDTLGVLNKGAKVKTMFGVFGEVQEIKDLEDTKIVLLKLYDGTVIEMDARGIYGLDERAESETVEKEEKTTEEVIEELSQEKPKRTRKPKTE